MEPRDTDFNWLSQHPRELHKRYAGHWLAIVNGEIVASGTDGDAVYQEARRKHPDADILLDVVDHELTNPIYGFLRLA